MEEQTKDEKKEVYLMPIAKVQERMAKMPIIETTWNKSKDGKLLIIRTTITDIKPLSFVNKVIESEAKQ